jgi:signal transduction histidine kinase
MLVANPGLPPGRLTAGIRRFSGFKSPLSRLVVMVGAALVAGGLVLYAINLKLLHDAAVDAAKTETRNLANVLSEHAERAFDSTDRALQAVVTLHDQVVRGVRMTPAQLHEALKDIQNRSSMLRRLTWTAMDGRRVATSDDDAGPTPNFAHQDSFRVQEFASDAGLYISHPFKPAEGDQPWLIGVSRRLNRLDGSFDGIAMGLVDPDYFVSLYRAIDIGRTRSATLMAMDGTILARAGNDNIAIGSSLAGRELFRRQLPKADHGTYITHNPLSRSNRIISYAAVRNYPLVMVVAIAENEALAGWWHQLLFTSAGFAVFLALAVAVAWLLIQRLEHDEQRRKVLSAARRDAVAANRAKSAFLSHMNHELRTPLNAILGFAELIRDRFDPQHPETVRSFASEIHTAGAHLLDLINDMLDLAKIEAQRRSLDEGVVDLGLVAERVLRLNEPAAEKAGVALNLAVPASLPRLLADERAVVQMLNNLVSNAIKFTPAGGRVHIRGAATTAGVTLSVSDTGIGIAPEDQMRVFERFGRSTDALVSTPQGGTGLGLAIVKGLIELHGGEVYLSSARGQGTDVTLCFPASRIASGRAAA